VEHRLGRPPDHRFALPAGATVVVDEAGMVATPQLLELFDLADRQEWRLALVGDPLQFAAIGRSGMFGHLVDSFGAIELDRVHRFTEPWERDASLALRHGDVDVVARYDEHGRLHGGTAPQMRRAVLAAWWVAEEAGERAAMMAPTNEAVVRLNLAAQYRRLDAGHLDDTGPTLDVGDYTLHVGDRIATRRNDRSLRTNRGQMVRNRDHWTIDAIHPDGSITATGKSGTVRLGADYTAAHVELAYAETTHANQGRTVDRSLLYLDGTTDSRGIYVALTRGRATNEAFVVTEGEQTAADVLAEAVARTWIDTPAITHRAHLQAAADDRPTDRPEPDRGPELLTSHQLRAARQRLHELSTELSRPGIDRIDQRHAKHQLVDLAEQRGRVRARIDQAKATFEAASAVIDAHPGGIDRLLRRKQVNQATIDLGRSRRELSSLRDQVERLGKESTQLHDDLQRRTAIEARRPRLKREQAQLERLLANDRQTRSAHLTGPERDLVVARLGQEPASPAAGCLWHDAAGHIAQHRATFSVTDREPEDLLGPEPRLWDHDPYATSHRAAAVAIDHLDRALGRRKERVLEIESPGLSL
ncbi:MAG: transfer protein TraA, partial [Acidimicrobiales bacterium]|nr:transfer protein TraA [Acidimicrobiales bacterium]